MLSPGFHSATLLVHLSGLWAAIRRARRHFNFFLCFDTICVVVCQHFSSESLALRFMYSVQTSNSSSWLHVLSVSFSDERLLSCPYSSFVLSSSCETSLKGSLRQNDETKQSALGCAGACFRVLLLWSMFRHRTSYCRCDNSVKEVQPVS